ncbi:MAG TPA: response regulator, partial [Candidatus Binatia bacterium]|nr:response regulator [Candidatus Binatia bacterium]
TGLGLAVVYGILQAHDGAIEVESAPGRGSTFRLFFPLPSRPAAGVVPARRAARAEAGGATLLIVDDEEHLLALLKWAAENRGFHVLTAGDGPEAVAICEKRIDEIDAVVLDCGLPKMSGRAVFEKLKEMNPDIVVVAVTGYLEPGIKSAMLQSGVKHFIHKPCSPDDILEKVALYCRPAGLPRKPQTSA